MTQKALHIAGHKIEPGTSKAFELETAQLYTNSPVSMPVQVFHGKEKGPVLLICSTIHGDEINGIEIIRKTLTNTDLAAIKGTLIAVPIVNQLGFIQRTRYLPDRRDLNRNFPGQKDGSLAARVAYQFMENIVTHATHIIDLHTAAIYRTNFPQIRTDISNPENLKMAEAFGMPVILNAGLIEGSLRYAAGTAGKNVITFEGGEALRFNPTIIQTAAEGVKNVMAYLEMLPKEAPLQEFTAPTIANASLWVRAGTDGILTTKIRLGQSVQENEILATIHDPFGKILTEVHNPVSGIVIGQTTLPLVHQGEALFHIATFQAVSKVAAQINALRTLAKEQMEDLNLPDDGNNA